MRLDTRTIPDLLAMLAYERDVESQRRSVERVRRSLRKIRRLEAELARRTVGDAGGQAGLGERGSLIRRAVEGRATDPGKVKRDRGTSDISSTR